MTTILIINRLHLSENFPVQLMVEVVGMELLVIDDQRLQTQPLLSFIYHPSNGSIFAFF